MAEKIKKEAKKEQPPQEREETLGELSKSGPGKIKKTKIKVIGIGGGAGNIVSEIALRLKRASFLAANTDLEALKLVSKRVECFSFGQSFTRGLGTGMNVELGEIAAKNEKERIKRLLAGQDLLILIACLGGGVGSGATPVFGQIARNLGNLSYGIFTLPFKFEGEKKMEIAKRTLEILRPKLNVITILPNERIFQVIDKNRPIKEAFSVINKSLAQGLEGLIETIYQPGLINIDFADLRTILEGQGRLAYLNTLCLDRKEGTVKEAVEKALTSPLYPYGIKDAKGVLFNIAAEKGLSLEEVSQVSKTISEKANPEAKIIFGISPGKRYQNIIKTTIFATGLSVTPQQKFYWGIDEVRKKLKGRKIKRPADLSAKAISRPKVEKPVEKKEGPGLAKGQLKSEKPEKKLATQSETLKFLSLQKRRPSGKAKEMKKEIPSTPETKTELKVRKNALQLKKETEEAEREMLEKEKFWETPAFLKRKLIKGQ